jgi:hypothetical protein
MAASDLIIILEVVLSLLLESFRFSLTEKEVVWDLGFIVSPKVKGDSSGQPQLPLRVTCVIGNT